MHVPQPGNDRAALRVDAFESVRNDAADALDPIAANDDRRPRRRRHRDGIEQPRVRDDDAAARGHVREPRRRARDCFVAPFVLRLQQLRNDGIPAIRDDGRPR